MSLKTCLTYPILLMVSTAKRSFEELGKIIKKSGDTAKRLLNPAESYFKLSQKISQELFKNSKILTLNMDDTLLLKRYSQWMEGTGYFYDTKLYRKMRSYRVIAASITNGKYAVPLLSWLMFDEDLMQGFKSKTKLEFTKVIVFLAKKLFPLAKIRLVADGLFASIEILDWCLKNGIEADFRMARNRVVEFKGERLKISEIEELELKGRRNARSVRIKWHNLDLWITSERRINKKGVESIVYIVSTYYCKPIEHVKSYKKRWPIEKIFRTTKQFLGIQECFSTKLDVQESHVAAAFAAYSIAQLEMKKSGYKTPEEALKALKTKKLDFLIKRFDRLDQSIDTAYA